MYPTTTRTAQGLRLDALLHFGPDTGRNVQLRYRVERLSKQPKRLFETTLVLSSPTQVQVIGPSVVKPGNYRCSLEVIGESTTNSNTVVQITQEELDIFLDNVPPRRGNGG